MKKVNNESIKRLSKNKIKNYFHILFGIILLVISLILIQPEFKVLKRKVLLSSSNSSYNTISNTKFDSFKLKINNNYNKEELSHIKKVEIDLIDGENYDYLNQMINLETLIINDYSTQPLLDNIDGSIFKNKMNIEIYRKNNKQSFTKEKFGFLKDIPYINKLTLGKPLELGSTTDSKILNSINNYIILNNFKSVSYNIESSFLESLKNVHNLSLAIDEYFRYDYNDLTFLDSLYLNGGAYDVAIYFSNKDIENLEKRGVIVTTNDMEKLVEANNKITLIIKELDIKSNMTDINKLDKVLAFVLKNSKYDEDITNVDDPSNYNLSKFYKGGLLKGFLDNNSQICGNYASIVNVLLNRLNIKSYLINSSNHIWNVVFINDMYYYLDPTWIDGTIIDYSNEKISAEEIFDNEKYGFIKNSFELYLLEPEKVDNLKIDLHTPTFIPFDIQNSLNIHTSNSNIIETKPIVGILKSILSLFALLLSISYLVGSIKYDKIIRKEIIKIKNSYIYS